MAPFACQMLGDLGAEVVKIETPAGDGSRVMGGGPHPELSGIALNLHRNKRSIGIDLKAPAGARSCCSCSPAATCSSRTCARDRCAASASTTTSIRAGLPRLVYCQAQGFRTSSDEADLPAYDDIIQALTGFPQLNEMGFGASHFVPSTVADKVAGMFIVQGVLAALVARAVTGAGQRVEVPMFDAALAFNLVEHLSRAAVPGGVAGVQPRARRATAARTGRATGGSPCCPTPTPTGGRCSTPSARPTASTSRCSPTTARASSRPTRCTARWR